MLIELETHDGKLWINPSYVVSVARGSDTSSRLMMAVGAPVTVNMKAASLVELINGVGAPV